MCGRAVGRVIGQAVHARTESKEADAADGAVRRRRRCQRPGIGRRLGDSAAGWCCELRRDNWLDGSLAFPFRPVTHHPTGADRSSDSAPPRTAPEVVAEPYARTVQPVPLRRLQNSPKPLSLMVTVLARFAWMLSAQIQTRGSEPMTVTTIPLFDDLGEPTAARHPRRRHRGDEPAQPAEPDRLLTAAEAAEVLGIGRSKLYELVARGAVQSVKLDRCRRFRRSDLDHYIRSLPVAPA